MKKAIFAAFLLTLASCATSKPVYLPDGRQGLAIDCSDNGGWTHPGWNQCAEKAGEACKARGYDVVSRTGEQSEVVGGSAYGMVGSTSQKRQLIIACK
jgi:hypothetical protein